MSTDRDAAVTPTPSTGQKAGPFSRQSRRQALGALTQGGLAATMTMLLSRPTTAAVRQDDVSLFGTTPAPEPLRLPTTLATVVSTDDLAEECLTLWAELREVRDRHAEATGALMATLTSEQRDLYIKASDTHSGIQPAEAGWQAAELGRHLPGLAPMIRMAWEHISLMGYRHPGACCTPAEGFEP